MPESEVGLQRIQRQNSFEKNFVKKSQTDVLSQNTHQKQNLLTKIKIETFTKKIPPPPPSKGGTTKNQLWAVIEGTQTPFCLSAHKNSQKS